jgi:PAS domain S-box-containing protein
VSRPLRVLLIEDSEDDELLLRRELKRGDYEVALERVETPAAMQAQLDARAWDLVIADYSLPAFSAPAALALLQGTELDIPFIIVSGTVGEDVAVASLKAGASDFLVKGKLARLLPAIERELREAAARRERRRTETALQILAQATNDAVWDWDLLTGRRVWNDAASTLFEYPPDEVGDDQSWWSDRVHPEDRERVNHSLASTLRDGDSWSDRYRFRRGGGAYATVIDRGYMLRDDGGAVVRAIGAIVDVTEHERLEEQLRQAQKMEAIGRLAGGVAHDFNNMLAVINGYSEMLLERLDDGDPVRASLVEINKAGKRAARLTRQLLAFSRKDVFSPRVLDLNETVADIEKMLRRMIGEDVRIRTRLDPGLGRVQADPGQIEQVLMNLAVNARDAMPQGGELSIETSNVEVAEGAGRQPNVLPGSYVKLLVADTGCGMEWETLARIFEPFFTTKKENEGTGLGLATVYAIIQQSGGSITVQSELEQGTTFAVYLPRVDEAGAGDRAHQDEAPMPSGKETVLLVEDEPMVRELVRNVLEDRGYTVLVARDAAEALLLSDRREGPIDLLLTEVVMPGRSGRELAEAFEAQGRPTRVLYISGYTDDAIVRHGVQQAETAFLQKPFTPGALARKVREVLDAPAPASAVQ